MPKEKNEMPRAITWDPKVMDQTRRRAKYNVVDILPQGVGCTSIQGFPGGIFVSREGILEALRKNLTGRWQRHYHVGPTDRYQAEMRQEQVYFPDHDFLPIPTRFKAYHDGTVLAATLADLDMWCPENDGGIISTSLEPHFSNISDFAMLADGRVLSIGYGEARIRVAPADWGWGFDVLRANAYEPADNTILIPRSDGGFISTDYDNRLHVWYRGNTGEFTPVPYLGHEAAQGIGEDRYTTIRVTSLPDGTFFSAGDDGTVRVWGDDIENEIVHRAAGQITAFHALPDRSFVVAIQESGALREPGGGYRTLDSSALYLGYQDGDIWVVDPLESDMKLPGTGDSPLPVTADITDISTLPGGEVLTLNRHGIIAIWG